MATNSSTIKKYQRAEIGSWGFSIIELIIYVAILAVISAVLVDMIFGLNVGWTRAKVEAEVQQNLRSAMNGIAQSVRSSSAVVSDGNSLNLIVNGQSVRYFLSGTTLQKQTGANPAENITTDTVKITYLNFQTIQNTAVSNSGIMATTTQFAITVEYNSNNPQWQYSQSATSTERLKN